jgi:hypothetical protein
MVNVYSYKPESADSTTKAIAFAILGSAGALILLSEILAEYKPILLTAGFVIALFGVLFCSRFLLSGYTYIIESAADGTPPDLVITEQKGKITRTVCRVSIAGGKLYRDERSKKPDGAVYDYRPSPYAPNSWVFKVPERDGEGYVKFTPDEKMIDLMREIGCEVEE